MPPRRVPRRSALRAADPKGLSAMSNASRQKFFKRAKGDVWAKFDAQPPEIRDWFRDFPISVWPASTEPTHPSALADAHTKYLAGLRDVWGPDHPAVLDAAQRVAIRNRRPIQMFCADDLDF